MIKKKKILFRILIVLAALALIALTLLGPIDYTPIQNQPFYRSMMEKLDTLQPETYQATHPLKIGWSKVNITPDRKLPMVGYKPREQFKSVHDSLFVRILLFDNGDAIVPMISAELMLFPPVLKNKINRNKPKGIDHIYFGATHTHNSIGGWDKSLAGQVIAGDYDEQLIDELTKKILKGIRDAMADLQFARIEYFQQNADEYVENRLDKEQGKTDGWIRGINIIRQDQSKASFITYSAHPTNISQSSLALSGDYPAMLIQTLENERSLDFAMFMAGMVGSHRLTGIEGKNFIKIKNAGKKLGALIPPIANNATQDTRAMKFTDIKIEYGPSQLRIGKNLKIHDWVFRGLFGELSGSLTIFQIGNIILIGAPCDFSGELYAEANIEAYANELGLNPIITSFNGDYTGYIIYDAHYSTSLKEEATTMNWVGPNYGLYFTDMIRTCLSKFSETNN